VLLVGVEALAAEAIEGCFDDPGFELELRGLPIGIELLAHPKPFDRGADVAEWRQVDDDDERIAAGLGGPAKLRRAVSRCVV